MFGSDNLRSSEMQDVGIRIFFSKGIINLKQVTAGEWMVVFCLVILAMSEEGKTLMEERLDNSEDDADDVDETREIFYVDDGIGSGNNENVGVVSTNDFIELLESF